MQIWVQHVNFEFTKIPWEPVASAGTYNRKLCQFNPPGFYRLVPHYIEQHQIIFDLLPEEDKGYRVLDLGCGNGMLSEIVFQKLPNSYVVGFDLTENMLTAFGRLSV